VEGLGLGGRCLNEVIVLELGDSSISEDAKTGPICYHDVVILR